MSPRIAPKPCFLGALALALLMACPKPEPEPQPQPEPQPEAPSCKPLVEGEPSLALPGFCEGDWCWVNPLPQGFSLTGVWSPGGDVAWAVGHGGAIVRAEGSSLAGVASPTDEDLSDIWGRSDSDVWAVGRGGTVLHWDGKAWTGVPAPSTAHLSAVSGVAAGGVWAGGVGGALLYWDGQAWGNVPTGITADIQDIWAAGPQDAWVTGKEGVLRCSPSGCQSVPGPGTAGFAPFRVQGLGPEDVYFLNGAQVYRWTAGVWSKLDGPSHLQTFDLRVNAPDDVWVSSFDQCLGCIDIHNYFSRWNGSSWVREFDGGPYGYFPWYAVWSTGPGDVWAVGRGARVHRRKGTVEQELLSGTPLRFRNASTPAVVTASPALASIAEVPASEDGASPRGVAVAAAGEQLWVESGSEQWMVSTAHRGAFRGISTDTLDVYYRGAMIFQTLQRRPPAGLAVGVHGSSSRNVWFTDSSGIYRWNASRIDRMLELDPSSASGTGYSGPVWAVAEDDVWLGGINGLHHWNGTGFEDVELPGFSAAGLWASWKNDVWAVGMRDGKPASLHWNGATWSDVPLPAGAEVAGGLVHVTGRCPGQVYALGSKRAVFRWRGEAWEMIPVPIALGALTSGALVGNELWVTGTLPDAGWGPFLDNTPVVLRRPW